MLTKRRLRLSVIIVAVAAAMVALAPATALASFGINPGKVYVDNLYPGSQGEFSITLYNQGDEDAAYNVRTRLPDYTDPEYEPFPHLDWITVAPESLLVAAGSNADVTVVVKMPENAADYSGRKGEAWISFTIAGDEAMVQVEIASRMFISTRPEEIAPSATQPPAEITTLNNGSVCMSPDPQEPMDITSSTGSGYSWVPIVAALSSVAAGIAIYMGVKRKRKSAS
jgi:hypothetical protein